MKIKMKTSLTQAQLKSVLHYDPFTGVFTWITNRKGHAINGVRAGYVDTRGYRVIKIAGIIYRASRLAYLYMTGVWPEFQMDHKNRKRSDDTWINLRMATGRQNCQNRLSKTKSNSGHKAVYATRNSWRVRLRTPYGLLHIGSFKDFELATLVADEARSKYHGEFASNLVHNF